MADLSYLKKQDFPLFADLLWNIPEQKTGRISLIGGNSQNFANIIKMAEFLNSSFPLESVSITLPDTLKKSLPPITDLNFAPSTESGSFKKSQELNQAAESADFTIFAGDLSKNSATAIAIAEAINHASSPILLTRDSIDLVVSDIDSFAERDNLYILASLMQLQKIFRALYFPKVLLLSMPLTSVLEVLHKFTLSYPTTIITYHQDQIIVANSGKIITTPIDSTAYAPITLWSGQLACKIAGLNLYNKGTPLEATAAAILA